MLERLRLPLQILAVSLTLLVSLVASNATYAQGTAFTYQGRLTDSGNPADGLYDMQFKLFNVPSGGAQQGLTITKSMVDVDNGVFAVQVNFAPCPSCFDGSSRFLEISVRPAGIGAYTVLSPRQLITSAPYAVRAFAFNWKQSGERDLGLAAEEVAAVEPLLVTYNERGQVEGVKYDRINIALINAVLQQQEQIRKQKEEISLQKCEIDGLKKLVCKSHPDADICR